MKIVRTTSREARDIELSFMKRTQSKGRVVAMDGLEVVDGHEDLPRAKVILRCSPLSLGLSMLEICGLLRSHIVLLPQT